MKQTLIALAVGSAFLAPAVSLAETTLYGQADVSLDMVDEGMNADNWQVNSNASRFGIKGSSDLDNGMSAIYKAEYEIFLDDGETAPGDEFKKRNLYAGIEGQFGQLIAGTFDTPSKKIQGKMDLFKDHNFDLKVFTTAEYRMNNSIQYTTPMIADMFEVKVAIAPGEQTQAADGPTADDGVADKSSVSFKYHSGPIYAGLSFDSDVSSSNSVGKGLGASTDDRTLLVLGYHQDMIRLGFLYETSENTAGTLDYTGYILSGGYEVGNVLYKAQFGSGEWETTGVATTTDQDGFAVGLDYALAAKTKAYVEYTSIEAETGTLTNLEQDVFAVGMLHKF